MKLELEDYQKRMIDEKTQLDERLEKLISFIDGEIFKQLDPKMKQLLVEQRRGMQVYSKALGDRLTIILT